MNSRDISRPEDVHTYIAIDLKSFYASVECVEKGFDPLTTNLVVADRSRTEKTICLAVSPSLKACGIPGRARLFEVVQKVRAVNAKRRRANGGDFRGKSCDAGELLDPSLELDYHVAPPRMNLYMEYSARIYGTYLRHVAPEDIIPYSIDEVFIDATAYLGNLRITAREFAERMMKDVLRETGITATAGIGPNLYLAKVAMDVGAKHVEAGPDGSRIAELDMRSYREKLWSHRPLTDFWRVGSGYRRKLEENGLFTMGDIARCSESQSGEDLLYRLFGVNAELLIDHAWGYEPITIADIRAFEPENHSVGSGQVLQRPYTYEEGRLVVREMADLLALDLLDRDLVTDSVVLTVGYDIENLKDSSRASKYRGEVTVDRYGRKVPKHAHGTERIGRYTNSAKLITEAMMNLYDKAVSPDLLLRRVTVVAGNVLPEAEAPSGEPEYEQLDLFTDFSALEKSREEERAALDRERSVQKAVLELKKKFGKNAVLRGMNLEKGATTMERNGMTGGHRA